MGAAFCTSFVYVRGMLANDQITQIAREVAQANTAPQSVRNVLAEPAIDSEGEDGLRITIVVASDAAEKLSGQSALDILVQLLDRLRQAGEERFPLIEYATEDELENIDDTES